MKLTNEQKAVVSAGTHSSFPHLSVNGYAGAAKTTTMLAMAAAMPHRRGRAFFFNKEMADDMSRRIAADGIRNLEASTLHSFAYRTMIRIYGKRMSNNGNLTVREVVAALGIQEEPLVDIRLPERERKVEKMISPQAIANLVKDSVRRWCHSGDSALALNHVAVNEHRGEPYVDHLKMIVKPYASRLVTAMRDPKGSLSVNPDAYFKFFVEGIARGDISVPRYDFVIIDEFQDSNGVTIEFMNLMRRQGMQTVIAGDPFQQIYGWRGSINAMSELPVDRTLELRQSFRFGQPIADLASNILKHLGSDVTLLGNPERKSRICTFDGFLGFSDKPGNAIVCRTNAGVIETAIALLDKGVDCYLPKARQILNLVLDMVALMDMREGSRKKHQRGSGAAHVFKTELRIFKSYSEFLEHIEEDDSAGDLKRIHDLLLRHTADKLVPMLDLTMSPEGAQATVTTAHGSKGQQWPAVLLLDDYPYPSEQNLNSKNWDEELRLLYVACTRAQHLLDISGCDLAREIHDGVNPFARAEEKLPSLVVPNVATSR